MIGFIVVLIIIGLVAGFLARALVPGDDSMGIGATIVLGIIGSFLGGFLASLLFGGDNDNYLRPAGLLGSVVGAVIALLVYNATSGRRSR